MSPVRIGQKQPYRHFIREWMKVKGVTQTRLADRLEIQQGTVSKILNKPSALTQEYLVGIAEALGVELPDLFRSPDRPTQDELLAGLTDAERETVLTMIKALRKAG